MVIPSRCPNGHLSVRPHCAEEVRKTWCGWLVCSACEKVFARGGRSMPHR